MGRRTRTILGVGVAIVLVVGFGFSRLVGGVGGGPAVSCAEPVAWEAAAASVGERAAVVGPVVAASHEPEVGGAPTFLNLGAEHPETPRFDVVIYEDVRDGFDAPPEDTFADREVCVQGRVRDRDGVPQIVLDTPAALTER